MNLHNLKKKTVAVALSISMIAPMAIVSTSANAGGIPTFDSANVAQAITQVQNQIKQIENLRNQLQAVTGNARLGVLLNDPTVNQALSKYTKGVNLGDLASGRYDKALQDIANKLEKEMKTAQKNQDPKVQLAKAQIMSMANVQKSMDYLEQLEQRTSNIIGQINATTDASSKADLANTLSANSQQIQIATARIQLGIKQMEMNEKQAERQAGDSFRKKLRNTNGF